MYHSHTSRQTRHTCAPAIKSLTTSFPEPRLSMTNSWALKLHQALRNAVQTGANEMERGHYSMLEAAEHWCQLFYSHYSKIKLGVHTYKKCWGKRQRSPAPHRNAGAATWFQYRHLKDIMIHCIMWLQLTPGPKNHKSAVGESRIYGGKKTKKNP